MSTKLVSAANDTTEGAIEALADEFELAVPPCEKYNCFRISLRE
jgi:hypothetical protein